MGFWFFFVLNYYFLHCLLRIRWLPGLGLLHKSCFNFYLAFRCLFTYCFLWFLKLWNILEKINLMERAVTPENGKTGNGKTKTQISPLKSGFQVLKSPLPLSLIPIIYKSVPLFLCGMFSQKNPLAFVWELHWVHKLNWGELTYFPMLSFLIHENGLFFYLFRTSSIIIEFYP